MSLLRGRPSPIVLVLASLACAPAGGGAATAAVAEPCLPSTASRWALPTDSTRVVRVWLDESQQRADGWSTYGRRRLRTAVDAWNYLRLPVQFALATGAREAEVVVNIVDSVPPQQQLRATNQAGLTHLTSLSPGEIEKAHVFIAVAASYGIRYKLPDQQATLLHELGHALGLPHATGPKSLMSERRFGNRLTGTDISLARSHYRRARCTG